MVKYILTYCFLGSFLGITQSAYVDLKINPTTVEVGESFNISITSNVPGDVEVENRPGSFVPDLNMQKGHYPVMDHATGKVSTVYYLTYSGMITKSGEYTIGPAFVKDGNKVYKSGTVKLKVGKRVAMSSGQVTASQLNDPAFGVIEVNKKEIYEGEPVLVAAKIYSFYDPNNIGGYQPYDIKSTILKHPIGNNNNIKINTEVVKGKKLYTFNYDKNVIFPDGVGNFHIDPFKCKLYEGRKSFPITSNGMIIRIKPLPSNPPTDFIGAVGDFRITRNLDTVKIKQGDVFKMYVIVAGAGNLQNILEPTMNLPAGFVIYGDPVINEEYTVGIHGTEGQIEFEYNVQVTKHGQVNLPPTSISYFDPKQEKYIQVMSEGDQLEIEKNELYEEKTAPKEEPKTEEIATRNTNLRSQPSLSSKDSFFGSGIFWTGVGLPICSAFIFFLMLKRREKSADIIEEKQILRAKSSELSSLIAEAKILGSSDQMDKFYTSIESIIRKAFEIKLGIQDNRLISKSEIFDYLDKNNNIELKKRINRLFDECEQSRYGFSDSQSSTHATLQEVEFMIEQLNI